MSIYDGYGPTKKDISSKEEFPLRMTRSRKRLEVELREREKIQEDNSSISREDRRRYMSLGESINNPFKDLRF